MDSLAQLDSLGSAYRDPAMMLSTELSRSSSSSSSSYHADKGKARARDNYQDDVQFVRFSAGESSATSTARLNDHSRITLDQTDVKGKGKQQASVCDESPAPGLCPIGTTAAMSSDDARQSRRNSRRAVWHQGRQSEQSTHLAASHQDDFSLKRSIRHLGSSPSSSPSQPSASLPSLESRSSSSQERSSSAARNASSSSVLQVSSGTTSSRPNTSNKKRRSDRLGAAVEDDDNNNNSSSSSSNNNNSNNNNSNNNNSNNNNSNNNNSNNNNSNNNNSLELFGRHALGMTSSSAEESSHASHAAERTASDPSSALRPSVPDLPFSARFQSRRTSLLVNSSTSSTRSLDQNSTFCVSPEPINRQAEPIEAVSERLQQRRSAFLDETRAHRSNGTIRRRRGFYVRDADPMGAEPPHDNVAPASASASSSDSFMSDFARAVDLRLDARFDHMQSGLGSSSDAIAADYGRPETSPNPATATSQRNAPQLPYVRAASPLTIPFAAAESDAYGQSASRTAATGRLRRFVPLTHHDSIEHTQRDFAHADGHVSNPARSWWSEHNSGSLLSANTYLSDRFSAASRTSLSHPSRPSPTRRNDDAERETAVSRHNRMPLAPNLTYSEQLDLGSLDSRSSWQQFDMPRRSNLPADPSAAARPTFEGQDVAQSIRRRFRLGGGGGSGGVSRRDGTFFAREPQRAAPATAPERAPNTVPQHVTPDRGADDWHDLRNTLPWRHRSHFGLRAPNDHRDRDAPAPNGGAATGASRPRLEPFADSRQPAGLPGSRAPRPGSLRHERAENESALEYLGRLMSHDSMLDEWMASDDVHGPLLRMAIESEVMVTNPHLRHLGYAPASTSTTTMLDLGPRLAFDARNFIADEDWAELNSYEGLMQLSERLGTAEICVPQSLIDTLPTCEYGKWDGGSCRQRTGESPELVGMGKGKGKQKVQTGVVRDVMCPICREDYLDPDVLMSINKCSHAFHAECIKTWFKTAKTCPLCRADAFDEISLPKLSFQSEGGRGRGSWGVNF